MPDYSKGGKVDKHKVKRFEDKIHSKASPYTCSFCAKAFKSREGLYAHELNHQPDKRFNCAKCKKGFGTRSVLEKHLNSVHIDERKYSCSQCCQKFKT